MIAVVGGLAGSVLAMWALVGIARMGPMTVPWIETLRLDWRALAFAGAAHDNARSDKLTVLFVSLDGNLQTCSE